MPKLLFSALTVIAAVSGFAREEVKPYLPETVKPPMVRALSAAEVRLQLPAKADFAPADMISSKSLNGQWKFSGLTLSAVPFAAAGENYDAKEFDDAQWETIKVPLNWYNDPRYSYAKCYKAKEPFVKAYYCRDFSIDATSLTGRVVRLNFGVIGYEGTVFVNGKFAGRAHGDFVPSSFDVTKLVKPGNNEIAIRVLSDFGPPPGSDLKNVRTYGAKWWYENVKGGLWQDVSLSFEPLLRFDQLKINSRFDAKELQLNYVIENNTANAVTVQLKGAVTSAALNDANSQLADADLGAITLQPGKNTGEAVISAKALQPWSPAAPKLYFLSLYLENGPQIVGAKVERFGFRELKTSGTRFLLNNEPVYLFGENIHSTRYGGYDRTPAEERQLIYDYIAEMKQNGCLVLRTAHMPPLPLVPEIADEMGMMILDEWSWSFTTNLDEPVFEANNRDELQRFLLRDYNHPSVVAWSLANEVKHANNPVNQRQLAKQIEWTRALDLQKRPLSVFSGSANWDHYGRTRFDVDFLDLHSYHGLVDLPWPELTKHLDHIYQGCAEIYGDGKTIEMPLVAWEFVGYSWGAKRDPEFRPNDIDAYAKYAAKKYTWGQPEGIGYSAAVGLSPMLDPKRNLRYAMNLQGGRILELVRQDPRIQGFAPWFGELGLIMPPRWNQPVYVGLRMQSTNLPPRNLFAGRDYQYQLYVINDSNRELKDVAVKVELADDSGAIALLANIPLPPVAAASRTALPVKFTIPAKVKTPGAYQLRLTIDGVSRNYANISLESPTIMTAPVTAARKVAVLDAGNGNTALTQILTALQIAFTPVKPGASFAGYQTLIIPPGGAPGVDQTAVQAFLQAGGTVLVLEQSSGTVPGAPAYQYMVDGNSFADIAILEHPIFRDMEQYQFDLWPDHANGNVLDAMITPFGVNALAVKGPFLYKTTIGTAIFEAKVGNGLLIASQLNASKLWNHDSAATKYLRNLLTYAVNNERYAKTRELVRTEPPEYQADPATLEFIDLAPYANRSFTDETDGDGKGGWLDQGKNDFRHMPLGKIKAGGVDFLIIDPAKNQGKGCLIVRGKARPEFASAITGIKVDKKFSRLFFLHTSGWANNAESGSYVIHYADGKSETVTLIGGKHIGDWYNCKQLSNAKIGFVKANAAGANVGFYVMEWVNPRPAAAIASIDFVSAIKTDAGGVDYIKNDSAVPVLAAITGEIFSDERLVVTDGSNPQEKWSPTAWNGGKMPKITIIQLPENAPAKFAAQILLPENVDNGVPVAATAMKAAAIPAGAKFVSFWLKSEQPGVIDVVLPKNDWSSVMLAQVPVNNPEWTRVKLSLDKDFSFEGPKFARSELRNSFYIYNGMLKHRNFPRQAVKFLITKIEFE